MGRPFVYEGLHFKNATTLEKRQTEFDDYYNGRLRRGTKGSTIRGSKGRK